jgi:hypothetical protein
MSTYTSKAQARELADLLKKWLVATLPVCTEGFDANGDPTILMSADATPAAGEKVLLIRIKQVSNPLAKDVLGNTAIQFGPHVIQLCTEDDSGAADILTPAQLAPLLCEIGRKGAEFQWYETANGTVPSVAALDALESAGTVGGYWQNLYWNVQSAS